MRLHDLRNASSVSIKRCHGLGNVVMLLPVLDQLAGNGLQVNLITRPQWTHVFQTLYPRINVSDQYRADAIDLDAMTEPLKPNKHRTLEFAELLGVEAPLEPPRFEIPKEWSRRFLDWTGAIGFAPEASHPSRRWPTEHALTLASNVRSAPLVLLGATPVPTLPCALDTRGQLELEDLLGLLSVLRALICMDSGILHLGAALGVPTICIFGGVDPLYRIAGNQQVLALQANLTCCPCNKEETCEGAYTCIKTTSPETVLEALQRLEHVGGRQIQGV